MVFPKRYMCFKCWCWWWICWILVILWHTTGPTKRLSSLLKAINIKSSVWFVGMLCPCQWGGGGLSCPTQPPRTPGVQSIRVGGKELPGSREALAPGFYPGVNRCAGFCQMLTDVLRDCGSQRALTLFITGLIIWLWGPLTSQHLGEACSDHSNWAPFTIFSLCL